MSTDLVPSSTRRTSLARLAGSQALAAAPWLDDPVYHSALRDWAYAQATVTLITEEVDRDPEDRDLRTELRHWQHHAARLRADLGLTPASRARLKHHTKRGPTILDLMAELEDDAEVIPEAPQCPPEASNPQPPVLLPLEPS